MARVVISVRVDTTTADAIDGARGGMSRSRWVEQLIEDALGGDQQEPMTATARKTPKDATAGCDHPRARVIKGFCYKCGSLVLPK